MKPRIVEILELGLMKSGIEAIWELGRSKPGIEEILDLLPKSKYFYVLATQWSFDQPRRLAKLAVSRSK